MRHDDAGPARRVPAAMADLPQNERAVLELVVIDELSVGEAAAVLGIRQGQRGTAAGVRPARTCPST